MSVAISQRIKKLGFESIDSILKKVSTPPIQFFLADFGQLNKESIKMMDDNLKILISGTVRTLERQKAEGQQLSWENVISGFSQNSLMEPVPHQDINKSDIFSKKINDGLFQFGGTVDQQTIKEVEAWFVQLVNNNEYIVNIFALTKIIDVLGQFVGSTGTRIVSFKTFFAAKDYNETTIADIGILRFPDIDNPCVKVYRIKLKAWRDVRRIGIYQKDENGIIGQFNSRNYKPRASVISNMKKETHKTAVKEAESLFDI